MRSIRRTLALWVAVVVFGGTAVFGMGTYLLMRRTLVSDYQKVALDQLQSVANTVKVWTDGDIYVELNPALMTGYAAGGDRGFVVRTADGAAVIAQSVSLDVSGTTFLAAAGATAEVPVLGTGTAPNGSDAIVATQVMPAQWGWDLSDPDVETAPGVRETRVELTVGIDRTPLDVRLRDLGLLTASIAVAAALAAAAAALVGTRAALRPLSDLARQAGDIRQPTHDRPFRTDGPAELRPITERLNDLVARLADASLVERRFTADAAHELRTPVAELRTLTDVALKFPTAPEQFENVVRSSNALAVRLTSLIDALLGIARGDMLASALDVMSVDPAELIRESVAAAALRAERRGQTIALRAPDAHRIVTNETLLRSIVNNLVGNALAHAPEGAAVTVAYEVVADGFRLSVSNPAPDLEVADVAKAFHPFWRKSRTASEEGHTGLGLALCRSYADILGLELEARRSAPGTFEIVLRGRTEGPAPTRGVTIA